MVNKSYIKSKTQRGGAKGNWKHAKGDSSRMQHEFLAKALQRISNRLLLYDLFPLEELEAKLGEMEKQRKDGMKAVRIAKRSAAAQRAAAEEEEENVNIDDNIFVCGDGAVDEEEDGEEILDYDCEYDDDNDDDFDIYQEEYY